MLVLGLDTSTPAVTVALVDVDAGFRVLAANTVVDARRHGELLAVGIGAVLADGGAQAHDLAAVVTGLGPGPFTGLRVGVTTGVVLSDALAIPAYGVCSLDALARSARGPVVVATDARRKEVYWARYDVDGHRVDGPHVTRPAELGGWLRPGERVVGDGVFTYPDLTGPGAAEGPRYPSAADLVALAADRVRAAAPTERLVPLYLRRPDAVPPVPVGGHGQPDRVAAT